MPADFQARHLFPPYPFGVLPDAEVSEQIAYNGMQQGQVTYGHTEEYSADDASEQRQEEEHFGVFLDERGMEKPQADAAHKDQELLEL